MAKRLLIRHYGDPILQKIAEPIRMITVRHRELAEDMIETMKEEQGIGLAATQVGVLERLIIVDVLEHGGSRGFNPIVMVNPEVIEESVEDVCDEEGCLSLPNLRAKVWRSASIRCRYQTLNGKVVELSLKGIDARCVLHEIDHLNGILYVDNLTLLEREALVGELSALRRQTEIEMQSSELSSPK